MRCLVTGGSGFVGANLVCRLLHEGHEVHLLLRPEYEQWRLKKVLSSCEVHLCDLQDHESVDRSVKASRPDWVFHLAAYGAYPNQTNTHNTIKVNLIDGIPLVNSCLKFNVGSYINTGSSSEYGLKDHAPWEGEILEPISIYGISKAAATQYCSMASRTQGLPGRTLRLYSVFGPMERPSRLIPTLLRNAKTGSWPPLASADAAHDFVYVDDVAEAYLKAATIEGQSPGAIYNIGSGKQTTLGELTAVVNELFPMPFQPVWGSMPDRPWDTSVWVSNPTRAADILGWRASTPLKEGLRLTLEQLP